MKMFSSLSAVSVTITAVSAGVSSVRAMDRDALPPQIEGHDTSPASKHEIVNELCNSTM